MATIKGTLALNVQSRIPLWPIG